VWKTTCDSSAEARLDKAREALSHGFFLRSDWASRLRYGLSVFTMTFVLTLAITLNVALITRHISSKTPGNGTSGLASLRASEKANAQAYLRLQNYSQWSTTCAPMRDHGQTPSPAQTENVWKPPLVRLRSVLSD
jgi:hypothetical protein